MLELDLQSRQPIYAQLKAKISEKVLSGELRPHDQLPSVRTFARDLGINPNTVQKAYQDLERDGIIYSTAGRGCFVGGGDTLTGQLRELYLGGVTREAIRAKNAGIPHSDCILAVDAAYKEGIHNDND
jgi:GntR family transcriptional regulator